MTNTHRRENVELRGVEPLASRVRFLRSASLCMGGKITMYGHCAGFLSSLSGGQVSVTRAGYQQGSGED